MNLLPTLTRFFNFWCIMFFGKTQTSHRTVAVVILYLCKIDVFPVIIHRSRAHLKNYFACLFFGFFIYSKISKQYPTDENYKSWRSIPIFESKVYMFACQPLWMRLKR